ncbi:hypothetical protein CANINC_003460 [Pichia inconspicua]|uniref:Uncharacterized protein n=1 Tax=Pichia inconspicua TaxID=52247 RepID=A0A4T0WYP3_9ASCO|nr:hypothetical protein CANINC_003460 [[Candida] inconspicua]
MPIPHTTPTSTPSTTVSGPIRKELEYVSWENKRSSKSWTAAEDELLRHLKEVEHKNWIEIATHFPDRTTNGCQFRWRRIAGKIKQKNNKSKIQTEQEGAQKHDTSGEGNSSSNSSNTELL